jgi:hypothetical protein
VIDEHTPNNQAPATQAKANGDSLPGTLEPLGNVIQSLCLNIVCRAVDHRHHHDLCA